MKDLVFLLIHLLTTLARLLGPDGAKAIVADSLLMKQQLLVINRSQNAHPICQYSIDSCWDSGRFSSVRTLSSGLRLFSGHQLF